MVFTETVAIFAPARLALKMTAEFSVSSPFPELFDKSHIIAGADILSYSQTQLCSERRLVALTAKGTGNFLQLVTVAMFVYFFVPISSEF